jgi:hypothetical protein
MGPKLGTHSKEAEKLVRDIRRTTRRQFTLFRQVAIALPKMDYIRYDMRPSNRARDLPA